jgi:hypothetical protein
MLMAKKRQTFAKMTRDRELKEKREAKRQRKADRKAAAAAGDGVAPEEVSPETTAPLDGTTEPQAAS